MLPQVLGVVPVSRHFARQQVGGAGHSNDFSQRPIAQQKRGLVNGRDLAAHPIKGRIGHF